ncbi:MAG TPA: Hpt domain-containing protein [Pseudolabrys sp.]|nr:Hpt domain-containing protein [Pseudolabrys sp.]
MLNLDPGEPRAPSLAPQEAIDRAHLARMTLGDGSLEREVLQLFGRQASMLLARMRQAQPASVAAFAHTINGSARSIGAWRVARAAQAVETAVVEGAEARPAIEALAAAIDEALAAITHLRMR